MHIVNQCNGDYSMYNRAVGIGYLGVMPSRKAARSSQPASTGPGKPLQCGSICGRKEK